MAIVQVADFGEKDGVKTYRVNGDKVDLERIIEECRKEDANCFDVEPELLETQRCWSLLIRLKVAVQVGEEG